MSKVITRLDQLAPKPFFVHLHDKFAPREVFEVQTDNGPVEVEGKYKHPIPAEFQLVGEDKKPLGWKVAGFESERMRKFQTDRKRAALGAKIEKNALDDAEDNLEMLAYTVLGWSHDEIFGEFSTQRAREILGNGDYQWIVEQLSAALQNRKNFFPT